MVTSLVFLDLDGVLLVDHVWQPAAMEHLNRLCVLADAEVVISSAWRFQLGSRELASTLREHGFDGEVLGAVSRSHDQRGLAICAWLRRYAAKGKPFYGQPFVVLDDADHDMQMLRGRVVRTDPKAGLTHSDVERALDILGVGR